MVDIIWNDEKIRSDAVLKRAFLGTKGRFRQMVLVNGESYELFVVRNLAAILKRHNRPPEMK